MNLPTSSKLPIKNLSGVFNNTTNSYKFYWFLAILEKLKTTESGFLLIDELLIEMIASECYPIKSFKLSFGRQDKFTYIIKELKGRFGIKDEIKKDNLIEILETQKDDKYFKRFIEKLARYVPDRFLTHWFSKKLIGIKDSEKNKIIYKEAKRLSPDYLCICFQRITKKLLLKIIGIIIF